MKYLLLFWIGLILVATRPSSIWVTIGVIFLGVYGTYTWIAARALGLGVVQLSRMLNTALRGKISEMANRN